MLVAVAGLVLVQRLVPPERREAHNDVAGFIYAVLGVAYAVLLAFMLISVWQDYETAQTNVENEAHELAGVYFLASRLPEPERTQKVPLVSAEPLKTKVSLAASDSAVTSSCAPAATLPSWVVIE